MTAAVFEQFNAGRTGTLWHYEALVSKCQERIPSALPAELRRTVDALKSLPSA